MVVLGSHNSWSYLPPKHWWMRPFAFMAKCQNVDIETQYENGVRCFDLRVRFNKHGYLLIAHGLMVYRVGSRPSHLYDQLDWLNEKGDCYVRVVHEVRTKRQYNRSSKTLFDEFCGFIEYKYKKVRFWYGRNLYNNGLDYKFPPDPTCQERHVSVSKYKYLLGWWPWLYAKINNKLIRSNGTDREILMIDFVNL